MGEMSDVASRRAGRARRSSPRGGFTLIEVMFATGVIMAAMMAAFASQVYSVNLLKCSRETEVALSDLRSAMDEILTQSTVDLPGTSGQYTDDEPIAKFTGLNLTDESIVVDYPGYVAGGTIPDPLPIVLTCTWSDYRGRTRSLSLASMKVQ
jgi:type II secretory pathway pseudopilin PulG